MSLDKCMIDFQGVFEYGMSYVALSRVSSLNGLSIKNFNKKYVKANPCVIEFYNNITSNDIVTNQQIDSNTLNRSSCDDNNTTHSRKTMLSSSSSSLNRSKHVKHSISSNHSSASFVSSTPQ